MVSKKLRRNPNKEHINADVIVLGCSLPGIVTAHKLKKRFGNTVDIVVLDLMGPPRATSKSNVGFHDAEDEECDYESGSPASGLTNNIASYYLNMYAKDFNITLPDAILAPEKNSELELEKIFEYKDGSVTKCPNNFNDFDYLNIMERFELKQYHSLLEQNMRDLFYSNQVENEAERILLLYYDRTKMEKHICDMLVFTTSREIMRNTVELVCGVPADEVSLLFYLHQCYRNSSVKRHLDGSNTRFREKVLGYCRKHLSNMLQKNIANITLSAKTITEISSYADEKVVLKTIKGDTYYVCSLLAMALKPDQLLHIEFEEEMISEREREVFAAMKNGKTKKFSIQYGDHFWREQGYSGDLLSIKGPIIWATERPKMSSTESSAKFPTLIGYLRVTGDELDSCREKVIEQLTRLFGQEAAAPVDYKENNVIDISIPRCGDFVTLRELQTRSRNVEGGFLEWAALDIFADGDFAAAVEAGHLAYLHLVNSLRPQAQIYEDLKIAKRPTEFTKDNPVRRLLPHVNFISTSYYLVLCSIAYLGVRYLKSFLRKQ